MGDFISILVSTFNRKDMLERLLASFESLQAPCPFEIIIVDNGSDDGTAELVGAWMKSTRIGAVQFHVLPARSSLVISRNYGIDRSQGNLIAFTDDDCIVDPLWLDRLYHRLSISPGVAAVGGKVLPYGSDIYSLYYTVYRILDPPLHIPAVITANSLFVKNAVLEVGLFDTCFLGPGGEEIALCMKLWDRGYRFAFEEQAVVYHQYRIGFATFCRSFFRDGNGERKIYEYDPEKYLRFMPYPERVGNHLAFRHPYVFAVVFFFRMAGGVLLQVPSLLRQDLPLAKRGMLLFLYACAQFSYHRGRRTFSAGLVQRIWRYRAENPGAVLPGIPA